MIRQQRRRLERQWNKIKVGAICTDFLERNSLFKPSHIIEYHAVKVSDNLVWVLNVGLFDFHNKDKGHGEFATTCLFVGGYLKILDSVQLGFIPFDDLGENEEIDLER
jgi:hypothetical protein